MIGWLIIRPLGILLLGAGIVTLPTPIPIGIVLIAFGLVMLLSVSRSLSKATVVLRRAYPRIDQALTGAEARIGGRAGRVLRKTRPQRLPANLSGSEQRATT